MSDAIDLFIYLLPAFCDLSFGIFNRPVVSLDLCNALLRFLQRQQRDFDPRENLMKQQRHTSRKGATLVHPKTRYVVGVMGALRKIAEVCLAHKLGSEK